jgi:hypothetical protein
MTPSRKAARRIFRDWCAANGLAVDPIAAADLVNRIEAALRPSQNSEAK